MRPDDIDIQKKLENENNSFKPSDLNKKLEQEGFRQTKDHNGIKSTETEYTGPLGEYLVISLTETLGEDDLDRYVMDSEPEDMPEEIHEYLVEEGFDPIETVEPDTMTYLNEEEGYNLHVDSLRTDFPTRKSAERAYMKASD